MWSFLLVVLLTWQMNDYIDCAALKEGKRGELSSSTVITQHVTLKKLSAEYRILHVLGFIYQNIF